MEVLHGIDIMSQVWDNLIILDACRYDYFARFYPSYLSGNLKKLISPATETSTYLQKTFNGKYADVVYISANPYVNSKVPVAGFDAKRHFYKIIDIWSWGVDPNLGSARPHVVNDAVLEAKKQFPKKRVIIHYAQPHCPYIVYGKINNPSNFVLRRPYANELAGIEKLTAMFRNSLDRKLRTMLGEGRVYKLKELLGFPPAEDYEIILRKDGKDGLRKAYAQNLRTVLDAVRELLDVLEGKTVITSDHGECLGESNRYGHGGRKRLPSLIEVPWFEVSD